ncbi:MAG TPA: hypothetical protein VGM06_25905 [Polyangiaceae bacterium]|jgi:hypothetical protein
MGVESEDESSSVEERKRPSQGSADEPADDDHVRSAWRSWLSALAADAEAAMAAALAYEALPPEGRDAWLDALEVDAPALGVPTVALYAPILATESDPVRRGRIRSALESEPVQRTDGPNDARALRGVARDGTHACVLVAPLYLDFVQVLTCRYTPGGGFLAVRHDPFCHASDVPPLRDVEGLAVEPTPLRVVVEELAHAILADRRAHRATPLALASFAHLFGPHLDAVDEDRPT